MLATLLLQLVVPNVIAPCSTPAFPPGMLPVVCPFKYPVPVFPATSPVTSTFMS